MERESKISQYRERLNKTLASHDLTDEKAIKSLLQNQLLHSTKYETEGEIENILGTRTKELSNFLDMLRSASGNVDELSKTHGSLHAEWKLKQDSQEFRVMYREGLQGTPFHTLLVEGYVDGPMDACLCVSWETALYKKWWPHYNVPAFKVISCQCLKKVRIGEHISLVRMKVSWPLSAREALLHYFEFEYFQDDLIIVLLNTISDLKSIDKSTHGFTRDGIPEAQDMVRIDVVGGFAIQKVTQERSYFRTIATMDMKLDFAPPSLINFISRQLIGSGFKLYQKAVASIAKCDEDFSKALRDPLYERIRKALSCSNEVNDILEAVDLKSETCVLTEEHLVESIQDDVRDMNQIVPVDKILTESSPENAPVMDQKVFNEIEEEELEESKHLEEDGKGTNNSSISQIENYYVDEKFKFCLSPEVKQALGTLDKVISMVRDLGMNAQTRPLSGFASEYPNLEKGPVKDLTSSEDGESCSDGILEASKEEIMERNPDKSTKSYGIDNSRIAPGSPEQDQPSRSESHRVDSLPSNVVATEAPSLEKTPSYNNKQDKIEVNGIHENNSTRGILESCSDGILEASKEEIMERNPDKSTKSSVIDNSRLTGLNSSLSEVSHNRILLPGSPESPSESHWVESLPSNVVTTEAPSLEKTSSYNIKQDMIEVNGNHGNNSTESKKLNRHKNSRLCCLYLFTGK